jgi:hypothetical protein
MCLYPNTNTYTSLKKSKILKKKGKEGRKEGRKGGREGGREGGRKEMLSFWLVTIFFFFN